MITTNTAIKRASEMGQEAFWGAITKEFPDIRTGDIAPEAQLNFERACNIAVVRWIGANTNE